MKLNYFYYIIKTALLKIAADIKTRDSKAIGVILGIRNIVNPFVNDSYGRKSRLLFLIEKKDVRSLEQELNEKNIKIYNIVDNIISYLKDKKDDEAMIDVLRPVRHFRNKLLDTIDSIRDKGIRKILQHYIEEFQSTIEEQEGNFYGKEKYEKLKRERQDEINKYGFFVTEHALDQYNVKFSARNPISRDKFIQLLNSPINDLKSKMPNSNTEKHISFKNFKIVVEDKRVITVKYLNEDFKKISNEREDDNFIIRKLPDGKIKVKDKRTKIEITMSQAEYTDWYNKNLKNRDERFRELIQRDIFEQPPDAELIQIPIEQEPSGVLPHKIPSEKDTVAKLNMIIKISSRDF